MLLLVAAFISVSCKSTPETKELPREEKPAEPVERVQRPDMNMVNEAKAKTDAAKKQANDFETHAYFPSEWEAIEARFKAAERMPKNNSDETQKAAAEYDAITAAYDEIFKKTVPLYAQA